MRRLIIVLALLAGLSLSLTACMTGEGPKGMDDALALAEKARVLAPRSGDAGSEKSQVDPSTGLAYTSMGDAFGIAAPAKAFKDSQNTASGATQTGMMFGGASGEQIQFAEGLIKNDTALKSIAYQIDTVLIFWNEPGGQTEANANLLVSLRTQYTARYDKLAELGKTAMPNPPDLSQLTTLGVFNWSSGYAVGTAPAAMSADEAKAASAAAISQWQGIVAIATKNGTGESPVNGGVPPE